MKIPSYPIRRRLLWAQLLLLILLGGLAAARDSRLAEISSAGRAIRFTGEVIIDTQELIKLELNRAPEDRSEIEKLRKSISVMLDALSVGSATMSLTPLNDPGYQEELSRMYMQWKKLEALIDVCRNSPENSIHLLMLSMEYYNQSKITLAEAEKYSSRLAETVQIVKIAGGVLLGLIAAIAVFLLYAARPAERSSE